MGDHIECLAEVQSHDISLLSVVDSFCPVINSGHELYHRRNCVEDHVDVK